MTMQPLWANTYFFPSFFRNKWGLFIFLCIIILVLSLIPQQSIPKVGFTRIDLVVHLLMYASLAYSLSIALYEKILDQSISLWWLPIFLGLYGFIIEVLQKILPFNRFFSWEDTVCNFIGACSFFLLARKIRS
jgi:VanZ family protein